MRALDRKLLRDLRRLWPQALAIAVVLAAGVAILLMALGMYRALIEGIAMGTAHVIEVCREVGAAPMRVLAVGGGTKNQLWWQATSDFGAVPQVISKISTGASYGNAFLAACAIGQAKAEDILRWNPPETEVQPQTTAAQSRQYPLFKALYLQTRDIAKALGQTE